MSETPIQHLAGLTGRENWRRDREGFSLVEILLAMGIVLFACLSILGVVPIGLKTLRDSGQNTVTSLIVDRIHCELQQADFPKLIGLGSFTEYFDSQGNLLNPITSLFSNTPNIPTTPDSTSTPPPPPPPNTTYTAFVTVLPTTTLPGSQTDSPNLASVQILIQNPEAKGHPNRDTQAFCLLIADSDPTNTEQ